MSSGKVYSGVDLSKFECPICTDHVANCTGQVGFLIEKISKDPSFMMKEEYISEMKKIECTEDNVVLYVKFLLAICEMNSGKENKAFVAMKIYEFLSNNKKYILGVPNMRKTMAIKLLEFEKEFPNNLLDGDFNDLVKYYKSIFNYENAILHVLCNDHFDRIIKHPKKPNKDLAGANVPDGIYKIDYNVRLSGENIERSAVIHIKNGVVHGDVVVTERNRKEREIVLRCYYFHGRLYNNFEVKNRKADIFGCYADSQLEGPYKEMVGEVETVSAYYVKGVRKPTYTLRYDDGTLMETSNAMGEIKEYYHGVLKREFTLVGGKCHGECRIYIEGKLRIVSVYEHGIELKYCRFDDHLQMYEEIINYPNGDTRSVMRYYSDMKVKEETYYYEDGRMRLCKSYFPDGELKKRMEFGRDGDLLDIYSVVERRDKDGNVVRVSDVLTADTDNIVWKVCRVPCKQVVCEDDKCGCRFGDYAPGSMARLVKMSVPASARRYRDCDGYYLLEYALVEGIYHISNEYYNSDGGVYLHIIDGFPSITHNANPIPSIPECDVVGELDKDGVAISMISGNKLEYRVGEIVYPDRYNPKEFHGIYVFKYPEMALDYYYSE